MYFKIKDIENTKLSVLTAKFNARQFILLCKKGSSEALLTKYLHENYNADLISTCLKIINKATYSFNYNNELVITVKDKELDKLASIITFGTGKVPGSNILKLAFGKI